MVKVEVVSDFLVEATSSYYAAGWKGEVSNALAQRHGPEGTGFLKLLPEDAVIQDPKAKAKKPANATETPAKDK
ncbi:hypothetical protein [Pedobacter faecalis]|uniref:hypothetical protein n=1 Tax=Pedobacter faecalis TaxID=3041495 RepID=UPI00254BA877|nr:hypothetical protein [Pedobacter sp. ELA7]